MSSWKNAKHNPSPLLIDWDNARLHWKKYHCTGAEAASVQLRNLAKESEFAIIERLQNRSHDSCQVEERSPATPIAARLIADELLMRLKGR